VVLAKFWREWKFWTGVTREVGTLVHEPSAMFGIACIHTMNGFSHVGAMPITPSKRSIQYLYLSDEYSDMSR